tara:strand:+ start:79 stop:858 length:780 start_codon:yes stop_codon:yes gene_type:complete
MSFYFSVSIILPTLNERENLKILIPEIVDHLSNNEKIKYEIIVIDDNSNDGTDELINSLKNTINNLSLKIRKDKNSLPLSILEGIKYSNNEYVMWLDADGSMPARDIKRLVDVQVQNLDSVIVGSRFVEGGGFKGTVLNEENKFRKALLNVYNSNDSVIAMFLSLLFNYLLSLLSSTKVKDMTSGFIIGPKKEFKEDSFLKANYGDYFVYLMKDLEAKNTSIIEVGYKCQTRISGVSKTGNSLLQLFKLGVPYIKAALK